MGLEQLYARRDELATEMRGLVETAQAEDRDLTEDEAKTFDDAEAEVAALSARIERAERVEAVDRQLAGARPAVARGQTPIQRAGGPEASREFESFGEFMATVRFRPSDQRLSNLYHDAPTDMRGEQRMDTGSTGGFMVPAQFRPELMQIEPGEAVVRPRAMVVPAGSPPDASITMPALNQSGSGNMFGGVSVGWIKEGGAKPATGFAVEEITWEPQEVAAAMDVTDKLLRNWTAASAVIATLFRGAVLAAEDLAFLTGNGVGKPLGFINSTARKLITRTTSTLVQFPDIKAMHAALLRRGGSPVWIASPGVRAQLTGMVNKDGSVGDEALIYQPSARDGEPDRLMGYPVVWSERSPALGAIGDLCLADLSKYVIKDGSGPFVATSEHVKFTENKTVFKVFWNVDGKPWLNAPLTLEGGFQASPFVVLGLPSGG